MTKKVENIINSSNARRVFNPLTGKTLDVPVMKEKVDTTDRIDLLIEEDLRCENIGYITRVFLTNSPK